MVKYLLDADIPRSLLNGLKRRQPYLNVLRVQQVELRTASDPDILTFSAADGRIVVSRDKTTMREFASTRIRAAESMPDLLIVRRGFLLRGAGLGTVIDTLLLIAECSGAEEWFGVIQFIPFLFD